MNTAFARTDTSLLGRWWWTVDRWSLGALAVLVAAGAILMLAASPPAAARINLESYYFVRQQLVLIPVALLIMVGVSLLSPRGVRRVALMLLLGALVLSAAAILFGDEIKGARRWLSIGGFSLQPSEFLKPAYAVAAAWLFSLHRLEEGFPGAWIATALCGLTVLILVLQPDIGMAVVILAIWFVVFFLAGMAMSWVGIGILAGAGGSFVAYTSLPHVTSRVDTFLDPATGDTYQVDRSINAFMNGGLFGTGPGEGTVKAQLPDAHSDFIFAVAGEEFGLIACMILVAAYAFVVLRGFGRVLDDTNLFVLYATVGLLTAFGMQALVNMASALNLIPTKGMTLPFISYGGSSLISLSIGMGMVLALTRRRAGVGSS